MHFAVKAERRADDGLLALVLVLRLPEYAQLADELAGKIFAHEHVRDGDDVLPLEEGAKVNLFGYATVSPIYGGTGSGASDTSNNVDLVQGLTDAGFEVNQELVDFYKNSGVSRGDQSGFEGANFTPAEVPASEYGDELMSSARDFSDVAVVMLSRIGGEGGDLPQDMQAAGFGDDSRSYLELTQDEEDLLALIEDAGFERVVLLINSSNAMELGFVEDSGIDSVMWVGGTGSTGFSAVGDGCICDLIARKLDSLGIDDYLVDIGGEMTAKGVNTKGLPWHIGINKPVDDSTQTNNEIQQVIELSDRRGIATSGDYRNFYVRDGKKYAHTINPKTGYPAAADILSATIMAEDCIVADAYATSCMALGREEAKRLLARHPELDYFFIYADSTGALRTEWSEGMEKYLVK